MTTPTELPTTQAMLFVFLGIVLSVVLPVAVAAINKVRLERLEGAQKRTSFLDKLKTAWKNYRGNTYLMALVGVTIVAFVIVFLLGMRFFTPRDATLAGFAWESLLNKLRHGATR